MDPSSAIWDATKCFCGFIKRKASYAYDLGDNLSLLQTKWEKLQMTRKDVEASLEEEENTGEMPGFYRVNHWLKRMKSVQEDIKDIQVRGNKQIQKKCLSKYCPKNCMSSYKLGKNVAEILIKEVDELETEGQQFCRDFKSVVKRLHKPNEMPCGGTVGLDLMFNEVCRSMEETNVGIIGLYGMGGVGKTTLLKKINNELSKRSVFYIIWVVVSKSLNLDSIMDDIRKTAGIRDDIWNRCCNQDVKAAKIYEVLKKKRFVLLLDDLWDMLDLEKVGVPDPKVTNFQSKVLFTTRFENVCAKMKAERKFKVEILTEKEAEQLFFMKVGEETLRSNLMIPKIAKEMVKECKGLPLALIVVGIAMSGVQSVETWEHSKNDLISASHLDTEVFPILKFSYDRLPDETHRKCFLYCALYPEDHSIDVDDLIDKWIGEGFLTNDKTRSVRGMLRYGRSIIEILKLSCLLEIGGPDDFSEPFAQMHDVIRDMALWIGRDKDRNKTKVMVQEDAQAISQDNVENWEMVERISIFNGVESWIQSKSWRNLRTLLLHFNGDCAINGFQNIQYASQLKVFELIGVEIVSAEGIGSIDLLEYLSLDAIRLTNASEFWRELKNLKNLKFLHLNLRHYDVIPLGIIPNLPKLKVLTFECSEVGVRDEREEEEFVEELECSSNLEELKVEIRTESGLNKLLESAKLESCISRLSLFGIGRQVNGPLLLATMSKMKHLQHLHLCSLKNVIDPPFYDTCHLSKLQHVSIFRCDTLRHLTWLKSATSLKSLHVQLCSSIEEVIKGEIIIEDEKDAIFPSLEMLDLINLPNLRSIYERVLSFPSLRSIRVFHCENLKKLPFDSNLAKDKLRAIRGNQNWWENLEWDDPATKAAFHSKFLH